MSESKRAEQILIMHVFDFFETWAFLQNKKGKVLQEIISSPDYQRPNDFTLVFLHQA